MYSAEKITSEDKTLFYQALIPLLKALVEGEGDWLANLANAAGILFHQLEDINWAGFYILRGGELVLGPYQGKPACTRIPLGRGVCGTAVAQAQALVVADVHKFPGHIACDSCSRSEIVLPFFAGGQLMGVLDIDSPSLNRFDSVDAQGLTEFLAVLEQHIKSLRG